MALNLEGFRIEIARAMYEDSIGGLIGAPHWFEQDPDVRDGFIKLAAAGLAQMFGKDPKDLVEFFAGHLLATLTGCSDEWLPEESLSYVTCERPTICYKCKVKALTHEKE